MAIPTRSDAYLCIVVWSGDFWRWRQQHNLPCPCTQGNYYSFLVCNDFAVCNHNYTCIPIGRTMLFRSLKSRLAMQYPKAYSAAEAKYRLQIEDDSAEGWTTINFYAWLSFYIIFYTICCVLKSPVSYYNTCNIIVRNNNWNVSHISLLLFLSHWFLCLDRTEHVIIIPICLAV